MFSFRSGILLSVCTVLALSALAISGCGDESSPNAPVDTAPPAIPDGLAGNVEFSDVDLVWNANLSDPDLAGYIVYRSLAPDTGYVAITATVSANVWTDETAERGNRYYYRVASIDVHGNISALSDVMTVLLPERDGRQLDRVDG